MTAPERSSADPRPGHPTVIIESHAEWPGGGSTEHLEIDAEWWDSLPETSQQHELTEIAVEHLANHAGSGADVVGRTDGTSSDDEPEENR